MRFRSEAFLATFLEMVTAKAVLSVGERKRKEKREAVRRFPFSKTSLTSRNLSRSLDGSIILGGKAFATFMHTSFYHRPALGCFCSRQKAVSSSTFAFIRFVDYRHKMFP